MTAVRADILHGLDATSESLKLRTGEKGGKLPELVAAPLGERMSVALGAFQLDAEEVADVLIDAVRKPDQIEAVKYWAANGLKALLKSAGKDKATVFADAKGKERHMQSALALVAR